MTETERISGIIERYAPLSWPDIVRLELDEWKASKKRRDTKLDAMIRVYEVETYELATKKTVEHIELWTKRRQ